MAADVSFVAAFGAGLVSFVSPCVLPLVPPYLAYIGGVTVEELAERDRSALRRHVALAALAFVLGFTTVFVLLGATASALGQALRTTITLFGTEFGVLEVLGWVAGLLILAFGLHFLGVLKIPLLYRQARFAGPDEAAGPLGAYLLGLAFGFGWTPCNGPILAAILALAGTQGTVGEGAALLGTYSLGLGVPFLGAALFAASFMRAARSLRRHLGAVEKVMGAALVVTGLLFLTGSMQQLSYWLLETFPALGAIG